MSPGADRLAADASQELDCASALSPRLASQEAQAEAQPAAIRSRHDDKAGRSLLTHPIILRDVARRPDTPPTQAQLNHLHRALTQRDLVILQTLHDYRYLDTLQVKELFFPSLRACQMRLQSLTALGVIHRWKVIETPGVRRRHSLLLVSTLGARVLADHHGELPRSYLERARNARDHCWHALHDLESNQFFISLATDSRELPDQGLLIWHGEDHTRIDYRRLAREYRWPAPAPDGGGVYLTPTGEVRFNLEWDRATESIDRLRQKIASYVGFWLHFPAPETNHVLVVVPGDEREDRVRRAIWRERPRFYRNSCCTFWTTTSHRLRRWGPAGGIWLRVDLRAEKAPGRETREPRLRTPLSRLEPIQRSAGPVEDCIGKPFWWLRRPGGGQVN